MVLLSCPSSCGNYSWENLPLSEVYLGSVFSAPPFFSVAVVWKRIFRETKSSDLQIKPVVFALLEETI